MIFFFLIAIWSCMSNSNKNSSTSKDTNSDKVMLYNFTEQGIGNWRVQDDVVMGGRSNSQIQLTAKKYAQFSGHVSLENNGGFCSMSHNVEQSPYVIGQESIAFVLRVKGDGKDYNFRVRTPNGRYSYTSSFPTKSNGEWETITIPFNKMEAKFRGRSIDVPDYKGENIVEMRFLIGNKKEESFELHIQSIELI